MVLGYAIVWPANTRQTLGATAVQADEEVFNREAQSSVCFSQNGKPPTERTTYQDFRRLNVKWQMKLAKRFKDCLQSEEYVQTRNALLILNKVVKVSSMVRSGKTATACLGAHGLRWSRCAV